MDKYNHHYATAIFFGILAIGIALTVKISAQTTYVNPEIVACSYTYSDWSTCSTSGKQTRTVTSKTPSGCTETTAPVLEQTCTYKVYVPTSYCSYTYSDWSTCSTSGKQTRTVTSKTPSGCTEATAPFLIQSCTYTAPDSEETKTEEEKIITPSFTFLNIKEGIVINGSFNIEGKVSGASSVEFYLVPVESNIMKYLGSARNSSEDNWEYSFDSTKLPNGSFYIRPKIKNTYGTYEGIQKRVAVLNSKTEIQSPAGEQLPNNNPENNIESNFNGETSNAWQERYFGSANCSDENICGGKADPDKDELSNNEEYRYGTNPKDPDSDGDGFLDGGEIKNGFNPLQAAPGDKSDKMVFESPKEKGEVKNELYKVDNVEITQVENGNKNLKISGKGLPNTFVTVYIYSDPIILTIKTDSDGNWSYLLDKDLEDGEHQVYVAVTDNTGKITAKSEPLAFVKTAQAVNVVAPVEASASERAASPTKMWSQKDLFFFIAMGLGGLALALAAIGLYKHGIYKKPEDEVKI